ncbi:MAG: helix-turn-helix transcriptional regulator, partial [Prevotella sp.]
TLLLANKNEVLQQISDITKRYYDNGKIPHEYVDQVNNAIKSSLQNDDEWSRFKFHFDAVHPGFFVKLKEMCQDLTENDLRLCAYISIGLRAKEIAEMLNVTPDSVNTNRYRLRKKLRLGRGESLDALIRKVDGN